MAQKLKMADNLYGGNINGGRSLWKMISTEDEFKEDELKGRQAEWKVTSTENNLKMEVNLNRR